MHFSGYDGLVIWGSSEDWKYLVLRAYIGDEHERPFARYGLTPVDGPTAGISIFPLWEEMLRNYYVLMGWHPETSVPLPETLRDLGIAHVIGDLENL